MGSAVGDSALMLDAFEALHGTEHGDKHYGKQEAALEVGALLTRAAHARDPAGPASRSNWSGRSISCIPRIQGAHPGGLGSSPGRGEEPTD